MVKSDQERVKCLASRHLGGRRGPLAPGWGAPPPAAVEGIADDRVAAARHVHPNLVGAPGSQAAFDEAGEGTEGAAHGIAGERRLAAPNHRHLLAIGRAAANGADDLAPARRGHAPDHGVVGPFDGAVGEPDGEAAMGRLGLGHHHETAGVLVQAVHDAGAADPADARKTVRAMGEQGVDQGTVPVAGRRMDDQAGRLVDHDDVVVFVGDGKLHGLGLGHGRRGRRDLDREPLPGTYPVGGIAHRRGRGATRRHGGRRQHYPSGLDQGLDAGT